MVTDMRTTLVLDDQIIRQAKRRAAERNTTLSAVVNDALREALREAPPPVRPFRLITFAGTGGVRHDPEDLRKVLAEEDSDQAR
jgi:hypothetical protein